MDGYIGEIRMFSGTFAPLNWAFCHGQLLKIQDNEALFAILGTVYGGDGRTTFGLPDLKSRVPLSFGTGPDLPTVRLGEKSGDETVRMSTGQMPSHNHVAVVSKDQILIPVNSSVADRTSPNGAYLTEQLTEFYSSAPGSGEYYGSGTVVEPSLQAANTGGGAPYAIISPSLVMNYIICLVGIFPQRN